ncbi:endolytic transglycosylase MltG [Gorillibacterium massiliense]|uniref:endolytic transglycosylase MltG n=1 Tax=Gorillibacterium massiliense TaxID=1280390 RepID=UPI0004B6B36F|nr:endolytic transglycosylase MltG [Gorillibacterium massiliense]
MEETRRPRLAWKIFKLFLVVLLVAFIAAAGGVAYVWNELQPPHKGEMVSFTIPAGTSSRDIADTLETKGIVKNGSFFWLYLKYKGEGARFQAGEYEMTPGMTLNEVIGKLNRGETVKEETIHFTVPEGYTLEQVAKKLEEQNAVSATAFLQLADKPPTALSEVLAGPLPTDNQVRHKLEGYLFPETYEMKKGSTAEDIMERMAEELKNKLSAIPDFDSRLKARGLTLHELLTVASLVEKESAVKEESPMIAGVIYNRLKAKMRLEIDATVQYALPEYKERLFEADLKTESPYNTYLHDGLPPGPIANPGLDSIEAALSPKDSKYLFYVTKKDGSRTHLFAETYEQHLKNIEESKKTAK